jgi:hypothetical protein
VEIAANYALARGMEFDVGQRRQKYLAIIAFASINATHVNTHLGAAERFVVHEVSPGRAEFVKVGGLFWVERAKARGQQKSPERFTCMEQEG